MSGNESLESRFGRMHERSRAEPECGLGARLARLDRLAALVSGAREAFAEAIAADFGHRARQETLLLEVFPSLEGIRHARRHLAAWMRPRRRPVSLWFQPGRAELRPQPLGVIGIIVPWNYPLYLAVGPLTAALAAGNRALVKMSEFTPATSALFARLVAEHFAPDEVAVVEGDASVAEAFSRLPFDHLLFTGSTAVGRQVMRAAAEHLTPVTLELGGKSPAIVAPGYPLDKAAARILAGKCLNAGQTCIAPDYVLLPAGSERAFVAAARAVVARTYPDWSRGDYSAIASDRHYARLQGLLDEARAWGAEILPLSTEPADPASRRMPPVAVLGAAPSLRLLQEELFGPILPLIPVPDLDAAIDWVNARPRPLALYVFDDDRKRVDRVLARTVSGGVTVNDTLLHIAQDALPFGGVGPSGMGQYHGQAGFETCSRIKPVFRQARFNALGLFDPPYGARFERLIRMLLR